MMKKMIYIILACVLFLLHCSEDKLTNSYSGDAKFIIDTVDITAEQKLYPQTDSLWCQVSYDIQYHFKNGMGYLSKVIFQIENYHWSMFLFNGSLRPPDIIYTFDNDFWIKDLSDQEDSLTINYYFEGVVGENQNCVEEFNDSLKVTIPITRL